MTDAARDEDLLGYVDENYEVVDGSVRRTICWSNGRSVFGIPLNGGLLKLAKLAPVKAWNIALLRGVKPTKLADTASRKIRILDLFCGAGGLATGVVSAARALNLDAEIVACIDTDPRALEVYSKNLRPKLAFAENIDLLLDYHVNDGECPSFAYPPTIIDERLKRLIDKVDLVIGGPPCQGHSNANNRTRHTDVRNTLYLTVPAIASALRASMVVIENVETILSDHGHVVPQSIGALQNNSPSFFTDHRVLRAERLNVAQTRRRHFLVASLFQRVDLGSLCDRLRAEELTVKDVIGDLSTKSYAPDDIFNRSAQLSDENIKRINYLFDENEYDLPNALRPDSHKNGHTYPSIYGRMYEDRPAQTITTGFLSPGRGRYIHPTEKRGLTPHEAARLQGFSDGFSFQTESLLEGGYKSLSKLIGDAVPPSLGYAVGLAVLSTLPN